MRLRILAKAFRDLIHGYHFYEDQSEDAGRYFPDSLYSEIESSTNTAGIHPVRDGYFRMGSKRFPFAIYYRIVEDVAVVHAVLDTRRDPGWIKRRLR